MKWLPFLLFPAFGFVGLLFGIGLCLANLPAGPLTLQNAINPIGYGVICTAVGTAAGIIAVCIAKST